MKSKSVLILLAGIAIGDIKIKDGNKKIKIEEDGDKKVKKK